MPGETVGGLVGALAPRTKILKSHFKKSRWGFPLPHFSNIHRGVSTPPKFSNIGFPRIPHTFQIFAVPPCRLSCAPQAHTAMPQTKHPRVEQGCCVHRGRYSIVWCITLWLYETCRYACGTVVSRPVVSRIAYSGTTLPTETPHTSPRSAAPRSTTDC